MNEIGKRRKIMIYKKNKGNKTKDEEQNEIKEGEE